MFIINAFKIKGFHAFLLFGKSLDTNKRCDRIVVDNWVELRIKNTDPEPLLSHIHDLRLLLRNSLNQCLKGLKVDRETIEMAPEGAEETPFVPEVSIS